MKESLLNWLCCSKCAGSLQLEQAKIADGEIESGVLRCSRCGATYPVIAFIPRFVPALNYADSFGFQWNRFRRTQLDSYSGTSISRDRFFAQSGWRPEELAGAAVLDAGCGAGRFAEVALSAGAELVAIDYSSAVDACRQNLRSYTGLHVLQADIMALPFRPGRFDYVYSFGVLQHTPDPRAALTSLARQLKPGGQLAVDIYMRNLGSLLHPKYWLRPVTVRLPPRLLFRAVERSVPFLLAVGNALDRVPVFGRVLRRMVPVANYTGVYPLDKRQLREWAVLDTFDWLSPAYDKPQTAQTLKTWLARAGLEDIEVLKSYQLVGKGRQSAAGIRSSTPIGG